MATVFFIGVAKMDKATLLAKLNQISDDVVAEYKDTILVIRVWGFEPMFVDFDSQIYNADCLPPLPPNGGQTKWVKLYYYLLKRNRQR